MQRTAKRGLWAAISNQVGQVCVYAHLWPLSLRDTLGLVRTTAEGDRIVNLLLSKLELKDWWCICWPKDVGWPLESAGARWHLHYTTFLVIVRVEKISCQRDVASSKYSCNWSIPVGEYSARLTDGLLQSSQFSTAFMELQASVLFRYEFSKRKSQITKFSLICVCINQNLVILDFWFDGIW